MFVQAKLSIEDLFKQIAEIKHKAEQSERMVEEVTRDIKSLDFAKKNLTASITTLKRLNMLVTGVAQLRTMAAKRQYREVRSSLFCCSVLRLFFRRSERFCRLWRRCRCALKTLSTFPRSPRPRRSSKP